MVVSRSSTIGLDDAICVMADAVNGFFFQGSITSRVNVAPWCERMHGNTGYGLQPFRTSEDRGRRLSKNSSRSLVRHGDASGRIICVISVRVRVGVQYNVF